MGLARIEVEVEDFVDAARIMVDDLADPACTSVGRLGAVLGDLGEMAGDDPGGLEWARTYDHAARTTLAATHQVVNAAYRTSSLFGRSGLNYAEADAASTSGRGRHAVRLGALPADGYLGPPPRLPSAAGGSGDTPWGWSLVEHVVHCVWPNGHQDRLHRAAAAWRASAAVLDDVSWQPILASSVFVRDRLPEADDISTVCQGLRNHLLDLATVHRALGDACAELAHHLDECHAAVSDELRELIVESAALQLGGAALSFVTAGIAEAPTQAVQGARVAAIAYRVAELIRRFGAAAKLVASSLAPVAAASERIRGVLESLAGTRLATAGVTAVPTITRTARVTRGAGQGVKLSKDARAEMAATERLGAEAAGSTAEGAGQAGKALAKSELSDSQASNFARYSKKLPAGAQEPVITEGANGSVQFSSKVPGRVPGSYAKYTKIVDSSGATTDFYKTTVAPDGSIVHVKIKFP